jgi:hypothetical protein
MWLKAQPHVVESTSEKMTKRLLIPAATAAAVAAVGFAGPALAAGASTSASPETAAEAVSENWSGYVAEPAGTSFSAVSAGWTVPKATCTSGRSTYSAFWVGLGGASHTSNALEQAGTQTDCSAGGNATYYAWYELVPHAPVKLAVPVAPGQSVYTRVTVRGQRVTVQFDNRSTGQSITRRVRMTGATTNVSSAEWIAEAPSRCKGDALSSCTPLTLTDFGTVRFHNAFARSQSGTLRSVGNWGSEPVVLIPGASAGALGGGDYGFGHGGYGTSLSVAGSQGAAPSPTSASGSAFSVSYGSEGGGYGATQGSGGYGGSSSYGYGGSSGYGYGYGYGGSSPYPYVYGSGPGGYPYGAGGNGYWSVYVYGI